MIWKIKRIFGLGKIFLSDNNPKKIMKRRAIFRLVDITEWKKEIEIKINKPPIIMGDLFSDPRILWEEYDWFSTKKSNFLKNK